jgi:outer membrane lipoprotein-sorting protein
MKKLVKYILIILFTAIVTYGQETNSLNDLQNKFKSITDFSADFVQYVGSDKNFEGKIFFRKDNQLRLELKNLLIITDGKTNWNYNKKQKKVIISDYDENDPSAISLKKIIIDYPSGCIVTELKEAGVPVIELKPETGSGINAQLIKIWMNNEHLVQKVLIKSNSGSDLEFRFSGYEINSKLPDSKFTFNPPEGIKIIDLR